MAKKVKDIVKDYVDKNIIQEKLEDIVGLRFGSYSKYIIQERAIPDARDGLKPVQRRILYGMYKMGLLSNKPYKKSARIVGEVMGKYHPHGDSSIYEALVRLSQDFKTNIPLVDMHGNNGSIDGDSAAAMRYTEARLSKYAEFLLKDIFKNTVIFVPNFDDEEYEPTVLPARFPNLLVNGSTGISSGYATDIPPHNLTETIDATIYRMDNPHSTIDDLMKYIKGPDFPTGGIIVGNDGIKEAYNTGKGRIKIRSKTHIKDNTIYVTEIPYDVNKALLVKKIDEIREHKKIPGIQEVRDESDRNGLTIAIELKKNFDSEVILNYLYKNTDLQKNYSFNMTAIDNKRPVLMHLDMILDSYIKHQKDVTTNRCNFELKKAKDRQHIVSGLIKMVSIIDKVIKIIRSSDNKADAKNNLCEQCDFSELQAEAIVTLQLYRLSNTDIMELTKEEADLEKEITRLKKILASQVELMSLIKQELKVVKNELKIERRTKILEEESNIVIDEKDLIVDEEVIVSVTKHGYVKRTPVRSYSASGEKEIGIKDDDYPILIAKSSTLDTLLCFTDKGHYIYYPVHKLPDEKWKDMGLHISNIVSISTDENIIYAKVVKNFELNLKLLAVTKNNKIKIVSLSDLDITRYNKKTRYISLSKNDLVTSVELSKPKDNIVVMTKQSAYIKYSSKEISESSTTSKGISAINMKNRVHDEVISAHYVDSSDDLIVLTTRGNVIRKDTSEIEVKKRINKPDLLVSLIKSNPHDILTAFITNKEDYHNKAELLFVTDTKEYINLFNFKYYTKSEYGKNIYSKDSNNIVNLLNIEREYPSDYFDEVKQVDEKKELEDSIKDESVFVDKEQAENKDKKPKKTKDIDLFELLDEKPDLLE